MYNIVLHVMNCQEIGLYRCVILQKRACTATEINIFLIQYAHHCRHEPIYSASNLTEDHDTTHCNGCKAQNVDFFLSLNYFMAENYELQKLPCSRT
jgi:hypothetical protein